MSLVASSIWIYRRVTCPLLSLTRVFYYLSMPGTACRRIIGPEHLSKHRDRSPLAGFPRSAGKLWLVSLNSFTHDVIGAQFHCLWRQLTVCCWRHVVFDVIYAIANTILRLSSPSYRNVYRVQPGTACRRIVGSDHQSTCIETSQQRRA
jgi:hypothetical protein